MLKNSRYFAGPQTYHQFFLVLLLVVSLSGCSALASKGSTGVVISRRAQVRSSSAVVAADLTEVLRGDVLDILDTTTAENGERWLRVRAHDAENTEGWIEGRNVMPKEMLDRSLQIAAEDGSIPAQATGQLRASTNLRSSPERSGNDNILLKLESGAHFEITGWKRVPPPKTLENTESDDAPKPGAAQGMGKRKGTIEAPKPMEGVNELWYKVRLTTSISPAPGGWVYGKQVELTVPSDIIFYRTGREFVAWQRISDTDNGNPTAAQDKDKEVQPGSWIILEKGDSDDPNKTDTLDFDRIYVLGYDKIKQEHYTAYRSPDLKGYLPLRINSTGGVKEFTITVEHNGRLAEAQFAVHRDDKNILRIEPVNETAKLLKRR